MTTLPEPPAAPAAGQAIPTDADRDTIRRLVAAIDEIGADKPTAVRLDDPSVPSWKDGPRIGDAPPVDQPGRPSMSPRATDASVMMTAAGFLSLCLGAAVSAVLHFSGDANQTVVITLCVAPPATFLALRSLFKSAKQAMPDEIHNHISGDVHVDQRNVQNKNVGAWVKNINE
ncbi:hypothetical protein GCM10010099_22830 [Streptomyces cinereus]|nr:hypothetical protein GCM10010099_22830 [Streptomyces cinereus]